MPENVSSQGCANPDCGHAESMHNSLGYCRSRTTPDRSGNCICEFFHRDDPGRRVSEAKEAYSGVFEE